MGLLHIFNRHKCIDNAVWQKSILKCKKCNNIIAIRYLLDKSIRVFVFPKYRKYTEEIKERRGDMETLKNNDYLGSVDFDDFDEFIKTFQKEAEEMFSSSENDKGDYENIENDIIQDKGEIIN